MKNLLLLLLSITYLNSFSQTYKGTLGKIPIYLKIDKFSDNDFEAFYFYENHLKNIKLNVSLTNDGYKLYSKYSKPTENKELFTLEKTGNKLIGKWVNDKKTLTVNLTRIKIDFDLFKQNKLMLVKDSIQKVNNLEIVWFKEKYSNISLFRIGNGFTKSQREFLNIKLDSLQNEYALRKLECDEYETKFQIEFLNNDIISFTENYSVFCGGAYPSHGVSHYNYDLIKNIEIENLKQLYPYFNFIDFLKNKYQNGDLDPECNFFGEDNLSIWKHAQFHLTNKSIIIEPSFPHAMAPCREYFEIYFNEIK